MRFDPPAAECKIYTFKEGLLATIAHDLEIRVTRFSVEVGEGEVGEGKSPLAVRLDAGSLRVVTAMSGGRPHGALSDADKRTIERNIAEEVLDARRFPEIRFTARAATGEGPRRRIEGTLSLHGRERALAFDAVLDGGRWHAEIPLSQPDYGIKPFSAMLGTLKIRPGVVIKVSLPAGAAPDPDGEPRPAA